MKTLAVLCSGGDGPGMNAVIRALVRTAYSHQNRVIGIKRGFQGLLKEDFTIELTPSSVGNILQWGGTFLHTSRYPEFKNVETRKKAYEILVKHGIDCLIIIGGDGSFKGGYDFSIENSFPVITIPASIDNDIKSSDYSIGFDTALHTAVEAIDKIRDTASSHERVFLVEVMGKKSPDLAIHVGVCSGAEGVILDPTKPELEKIVAGIQRGIKRGKSYSIIIVSEGDSPGLSYNIQESLKNEYSISSHVCVLGHIQRGGIPTPRDRFSGAMFGYHAAELFNNKTFDHLKSHPYAMVSVLDKVIAKPLHECLEKKQEADLDSLNLLESLGI